MPIVARAGARNMEIKNKVKHLKNAKVEDFLSWEFNTLKDQNRDVNKLINAIRKSGWSFPIIKWENYVIDGTGRKLAVEQMIKDGDKIDSIPYVEIEADNLEDAKKKALEVSSQFGEITKESFLEFTKDIEIDFDTFEISGISNESFVGDDIDFDDIEGNQDREVKGKDITITCPHCEERFNFQL